MGTELVRAGKERQLFEVVLSVEGELKPMVQVLAYDRDEAVVLAALRSKITEGELKQEGVRTFVRPFCEG